jgi:hypothetical protein
VKCVLVNGAIAYEFEIRNDKSGVTIFVTSGPPLSDFRAESIEGRATRVWKVYEKGGDPKVFYVLKDVWMFSDTLSETTIMDTLRSKVPKEHHNIFLTILHDDWVSVNGERDQTDGLIIRQELNILDNLRPRLAKEVEEETKPTLKGSSRSGTFGHIPRGSTALHNENVVSVPNRKLSTRSHRRTVFLEVCQPLQNVTNMKMVGLVLQGAIDGRDRCPSVPFCRADFLAHSSS